MRMSALGTLTVLRRTGAHVGPWAPGLLAKAEKLGLREK